MPHTRSPMFVPRAVTSTMLVLGTVAHASGQQGSYVGRPVAEVLQQLQAPELRIIFSSDLVPPTLRVKTEPRSRDPRQIARQILEPHGLTLQQGPRSTWLVVMLPKATASPPPTEPAPASDVRDETQVETPAPVDALRIEERVDVVDRLREPADRATVYTLSAPDIRETAGAFENVLHVLQLLPGVAATNDEDGKLAVRGAGPEHNLLVVDGIAIHSLATSRPAF
jgi:hypothetical protein